MSSESYVQEFQSLGITSDKYSFEEEEEINENEDIYEDIFEEEEEIFYINTKSKEFNSKEEIDENNEEIEENNDQFRPESILIENESFLHSKPIESAIKKDDYSYFKSDYYYLSFINELEKKDTKIDEKNIGNILLTSDNFFFRLFGFLPIPLTNDGTSFAKGKNFKDYLEGISVKNEEKSKDIDTESKEIWETIKDKIPIEIEYKKIKLDEYNFENKNLKLIDMILYFHHYGVSYNILFNIAFFFKKKIQKQIDGVINFSVGKQYKRNQCFVTFLRKEEDKDIFIPYILSSNIKKALSFIEKSTIDYFSSVSNQLFLLDDLISDEEMQKICKNHYFKNKQFITPNYNILYGKFYHPFEPKILNSSSMNKLAIFPSVYKTNLLLEQSQLFRPTVSHEAPLNFFLNNRPSFDLNDKNDFKLDISMGSEYITNFRFHKKKEKEFTESFKFMSYEYKIFVGLNGIKYPKLISSHISLFSSSNLKSIYVDDNMDKIYCIFVVNTKNTIFVEGDFGTQKVDNMKVIKKFDYEVEQSEFFFNKSNDLFLSVTEPKSGTITTFMQNQNDENWTEVKSPEDKVTFQIEKTKKESNENKALKKENFLTLPVALEISNKLFILNKTSSLYHPAWQNSSLSQSIISTFYRFAFHLLPDQIVFEQNANQSNEGDVVSAIIYPQIDIGFRGNIRHIFTSSNSPGIFEYSDKAFNFEPLVDLLPYTKTDVIFFNNGKLKVGLDRHRTRCQIAATSLFAFACSIYGPGMKVRDFRLEKGNPYTKEHFTMFHHFLIAAYGTLLKMQNQAEFDFALETIAKELNVVDNIQVYHNLMNYLEEDYY